MIMPSAVKTVTASTTVALLAGLGLAASTGTAAASPFDDLCAGMSAPRNPAAGNRAPAPADDTAKVVAGGTAVIKVLANDTDPDGDELYVVSVSKPRRGGACIDANGDLEYDAALSSTDYTQTLTYGVTDGDLYRTATVTVEVEGVKPVRAVLKHRLTFKKHTHQVKHRARVAFTNPNTRSVIVFAGNPSKDKPEFRHAAAPGRTVSFSTRSKKVQFIVVMPLRDGDFSIANVGLLDTRTGRQQVSTLGDNLRAAPGASRTPADRWLHR